MRSTAAQLVECVTEGGRIEWWCDGHGATTPGGVRGGRQGAPGGSTGAGLTMLPKSAMLPIMGNGRDSGNSLLRRGLQGLGERLPPRWIVARATREPRGTGYTPDALIEVRAPDGTRATIVVEAVARLTPAEATMLVPRLDQAAREDKATGQLVVTSYLSPLARERLRAAGVSYLDLTGNARVTLDRPALFLESRGADRNPAPDRRDRRSLKGGSAARIVRALADWRPPVGVRELARRAGTDAGYATRILTVLAREDVIARDPKGAVTTVRWRDLIRRWAQDYAVTETNRAVAYLEPRGLDALATKLRTYPRRWAFTGSAGVPRAASTAPTRTALVYVESPEEAAPDLGLRTVDTGANVVLLEPFDSVIWERTRDDEGRISVALSQCAVDLLTGAGREPTEAESLFGWMEQHESAWRA